MAQTILFGGLFLVWVATALAAFLLLTRLRVSRQGPGPVFRLGAGVSVLCPGALLNKYRRLLLLAGSPRDMSIETLLGLKVLILVMCPLVLLLAAVGLGNPALGSWRLLLLSAVTGSFLPDAWLSRRGAERQKQMRRALPDTLDLLTITVEAGLGFDSALARVVETARGPLSEEFARVLREVQLGRSRIDAFRALLERTDVPEFSSFVLAVIEAETFGMAVGQTLRAQSREMRTRRRQLAEEAAMKTPVKIVFPVVLCIFPSLLILIVGPAGIRIAKILGG